MKITEVPLYEGEIKAENKVTGTSEAPAMLETGDQLYLHYSFEITDEQMDEISPDTKYAINVPTGLKITGEKDDEPLYAKVEGENGTTEEQYATLTWGPDGASIKFEADFLTEYESLSECTLYFGCAFDEENPPDGTGEPNRYKIEFYNGKTVIVGLADEEPTVTEAKLDKTCGGHGPDRQPPHLDHHLHPRPEHGNDRL